MPRDRGGRGRTGGMNLVKVRFITAEGAPVEAEGAPGDSLLEVGAGRRHAARRHLRRADGLLDLPCDRRARLVRQAPAAAADEEDMLDLAAGVTRTSRLSCQIELTDALDGIEVRIPGESRDMQRR